MLDKFFFYRAESPHPVSLSFYDGREQADLFRLEFHRCVAEVSRVSETLLERGRRLGACLICIVYLVEKFVLFPDELRVSFEPQNLQLFGALDVAERNLDAGKEGLMAYLRFFQVGGFVRFFFILELQLKLIVSQVPDLKLMRVNSAERDNTKGGLFPP